MTAKPTKQRQQEFRSRHEKEGRKEVRGIFARVEDHKGIKEVMRIVIERMARNAELSGARSVGAEARTPARVRSNDC